MKRRNNWHSDVGGGESESEVECVPLFNSCRVEVHHEISRFRESAGAVDVTTAGVFYSPINSVLLDEQCLFQRFAM